MDMTKASRRPFPFTSTHEWVVGCSSCPFNHTKWQRDPTEPHCRKCGITKSRAEYRKEDIDIEACPMGKIATCRQCQGLLPIPVEASPTYSLCTRCLYPGAPVYHTVGEALKAMADINAGVEPDLPSPKPKPC